jgi:hypothetical protein
VSAWLVLLFAGLESGSGPETEVEILNDPAVVTVVWTVIVAYAVAGNAPTSHVIC